MFDDHRSDQADQPLDALLDPLQVLPSSGANSSHPASVATSATHDHLAPPPVLLHRIARNALIGYPRQTSLSSAWWIASAGGSGRTREFFYAGANS
jgi:hypothetical protein